MLEQGAASRGSGFPDLGSFTITRVKRTRCLLASGSSVITVAKTAPAGGAWAALLLGSGLSDDDPWTARKAFRIEALEQYPGRDAFAGRCQVQRHRNKPEDGAWPHAQRS